VLAFIALGAAPLPASSQSVADTSRVSVSGMVSVTTKGISTIPSFTLGKPAGILDLSIAKRGLSFDPQFRFGLDGKPWSFLFWGRYRVYQGEKLRVSAGAHPALSFRTTSLTTNGASRDVIVARRYLAGELSPTYAISRRASVGAYYLYSFGVETDVVRHTHFVAARASVASGELRDGYSLRLAPQVYYLKTDDRDGVYLNSMLTLAKRDLPLSMSTTANRPIRSRVVGGAGFLWNVNLHYAIE
jgi:hypothetical protein